MSSQRTKTILAPAFRNLKSIDACAERLNDVLRDRLPFLLRIIPPNHSLNFILGPRIGATNPRPIFICDLSIFIFFFYTFFPFRALSYQHQTSRKHSRHSTSRITHPVFCICRTPSSPAALDLLPLVVAEAAKKKKKERKKKKKRRTRKASPPLKVSERP